MKRRFRYIGLALAGLWANACLMTAQNSYRADVLTRMAESLQLSAQLDTLKDGCYTHEYAYKKQPLTVVVEKGVVTHIGYTIFSTRQRTLLKSPVYDFLERYTLAAALPMKREKTVEKQLAEDDIAFSEGTFATLNKLVGDTTLNVTIDNLNDKRYKVSWYKGEKLRCSVDFPIDYDLLHGTEMVENERRIAEGMKKVVPGKVEPLQVKREQLFTTFQPNYYVMTGESYYTDLLNTNRYYEKAPDGQFQLIFNRKYPMESLANLLTTLELENGFEVKVRLKMYDFKEDNFSVSLAQFVNYFLQQGCTLYFGIISFEENTAVCQLVARNIEEGYCHTMKVTCDVEQLLDKKGSMTVRLNSYIPTSRIKNLFEELKM
ncbi:MAG: hypothetical protein IJ511_03305 [Bacteroides sp.]|nr:hypothetical protein [Bacteroides sp.]